MSENDLSPRTVYLSPASIEDCDRRAQDLSIAPGQLLRMILLGKQRPLEIAPREPWPPAPSEYQDGDPFIK